MEWLLATVTNCLDATDDPIISCMHIIITLATHMSKNRHVLSGYSLF